MIGLFLNRNLLSGTSSRNNWINIALGKETPKNSTTNYNTQEAKMQQEQVIIYTSNTCHYCVKAKELLNRKKVSYKEIDVSNNDELRAAMIEKSGGRRTVPQIFISDQHIGGCDDLYALEEKGQLDQILQ